ncbi:hypothetical protein [Amycolatopsis sp. PS_44_ISF1]|uniref:hypothetical protein n=1 Tax=Amycolatopsis sp. PS_44_ISF1 TaxID=2974917 RepID=UPI0028DD4724|nr:hypothetical protein [Amycolatopsis sp. PS_44_ISF1]MDT8913722.1 hypothetical protein [Amycolatopsis sp. PS_44_ISF1]
MLTAVVLAAGLAALPGMAAADDPPPADTVPTDIPDPGGNLVFDGFTDHTIRDHGVHSMIYENDLYDTTEQCEDYRQHSKLKVFDDTKPDYDDSSRYHLREVAEFHPAEKPTPVDPHATRTITTETAKSQRWEHSLSVETSTESSAGGLFAKVSAKVAVTVGTTYARETTVTEGQSTSVTNPTPDTVRYYAWGTYFDLFSYQRSPWRVTWVPKGGRIYAGDSVSSAISWYKAPESGCYTSATFDTFKLPRAQSSLAMVYELNKNAPSGPAACRYRVTSGDVQLYPTTQDKKGKKIPDLKSKKLVDVAPGTCLKAGSNAQYHDTGEGGYSYLVLAKPAKKNGRCPIEPDALCDGHYWVRGTDVSGDHDRPPYLEEWGNGFGFTLDSVAEGTGLGIGAYYNPPPRITTNVQAEHWRLATSTPGTWKVESTRKPGTCMQLGRDNDRNEDAMVVQSCDRDEARFAVVYRGGDQFNLVSPGNHPQCLTQIDNDQGGRSNLTACSDTAKQRYTATP